MGHKTALPGRCRRQFCDCGVVPGCLPRSAHAFKRQPVCVAQQPRAHGQPAGLRRLSCTRAKGAQVVGDFLDVVGVCADGEAGFFVEEIG